MSIRRLLNKLVVNLVLLLNRPVQLTLGRLIFLTVAFFVFWNHLTVPPSVGEIHSRSEPLRRVKKESKDFEDYGNQENDLQPHQEHFGDQQPVMQMEEQQRESGEKRHLNRKPIDQKKWVDGKGYGEKHFREVGAALCTDLSFQPDALNRPKTALATFPGSGNTWTRYLIQQSTGFMTGSVYHGPFTPILRENGYPGESIHNSSMVVIKTHGTQRANFDRAIVVVRDPFGCILSDFNRMYGGSQVGLAKEKAFQREDGKRWHTYVENTIIKWSDFHSGWIDHFKGDPENLLVIKYDQLVNDTEAQLRTIINFLGYEVDEEAMSCTMEHKEGWYHRPHKETSLEEKYAVYDKNQTNLINQVKQWAYQKHPILDEASPGMTMAEFIGVSLKESD